MEAPVFHRKRYRFFYPAGLISLVLLPLIGIYYLYSKGYFTQLYCIEVNMPTSSWHEMLPQLFPSNLIPHRNYLKLILTGNNEIDENKLEEAQIQIRQIVRSRDSVNGVFIEFGAKAKYGSLIQLLDICKIEGARKYVYNKNWFLIIETPKPKNEPANLGDILMHCVVYPGETITPPVKPFVLEEGLWELLDKLKWVSKNSLIFWQISLLYIGLVIFAIINFKNRFKSHQPTTTN